MKDTEFELVSILKMHENGNRLFTFVFSGGKCILLFKGKTEDAFKVITKRRNEQGYEVMIFL